MGIIGKLKRFLFVTVRITKYKLLSDCKNVQGNPAVYHPLLVKGEGTIIFKSNVQVGVIASPNYYSHYAYIEARYPGSAVTIGENTALNNGFSAVAVSAITIGDNVLIGVNCSILDNDGHFIQADRRNDLYPPSSDVHIKNNVFVGSNVVILKGVTIGENSVIGNGSVVTKNVPANCIFAGNPARLIKQIP